LYSIHCTRSSKTYIVKRNVALAHEEIVKEGKDCEVKVLDKCAINCATVSEDRKLLGVCTTEGDIGIVDVATLKYINKLPMHDLPVRGCVFSSAQDLLMTGSVDYRIGFIMPVKRPMLTLTSPLAIVLVLLLALLLGLLFRR
jgi:hypothetical protein